MKPVQFPGSNTVFAKDQPEYLPLPAHVGPQPDQVVTSCWELSDFEIARLAQTKRIWVQQWTFGNTLQPQRIDVAAPPL